MNKRLMKVLIKLRTYRNFVVASINICQKNINSLILIKFLWFRCCLVNKYMRACGYENVNVACIYFAITDVMPASCAFSSTIFNSGRLSRMWHHPTLERTSEFRRARNLNTLTFETYNSMCKYDKLE